MIKQVTNDRKREIYKKYKKIQKKKIQHYTPMRG